MAYQINHAALLLTFIIDQQLELSEYSKKLPDLIRKKFSINLPGYGSMDFTGDLVKDVITWENGKQVDTLEGTLKSKYIITKK